MKTAVLAIVLFSGVSSMTQGPVSPKHGFLYNVNSRLESTYGIGIADACDYEDDLAARTVLKEYGAVFVAEGGAKIPSKCIFADEAEVLEFQAGLKTSTVLIGGARITLQEAAMNALLEARSDAGKIGLQITPRGTSRAASRSFADTKSLWDSRFLPGLAYWTGKGRITRKEADAARAASVPDQVTKVLNWEKEGIFFARGFAKSILFSVAAPGASQHISMLALDVKQFGDRRVRDVLAKHGWFQTVRSDYPHFTYLGVREERLEELGLKKTETGNHIFWVPDLPDE
jgi:hypothetical protein